MKQWIIYSLFSLILFSNGIADAESLANDKLLEILEQKGFLTEEEVKEVKGILTKEEEKEVKVVYEEGVHIRTNDKSFDMRIGGVIQTDLIAFSSHYPEDNDFDIRRARLFIEGRMFDYFGYKFEGEFEGASNDRLVDALINFDYFPYLQFQVGQFKEPFSLENLISDKYLPFNERSMAYYLTPARDVGLMIHGTMFGDMLNYGVGVFNGDGRDATRRSQKDDKEFTGRIVLKPFHKLDIPLINNLQLGGSFAYARLDTSDLNVDIDTPGRTTFFEVNSRAKFRVIQDVDDRRRFGFEMAYACGPLVLMGEYIRNDYHELLLSDEEVFDFSMKGWYAGMLLMVTGEKPVISKGVLEKIKPKNNFDIKGRKWGAWGIGFRYEQFEADQVVYDELVFEGQSVRRANSFTAALNWYLNSMVRFSLNYSRTTFAQPLFLGTSPEGYSYYRDTENVWVTRFQLEF